jgi:DNA-directed RNA polymerase specialized sigma24 family protein
MKQPFADLPVDYRELVVNYGKLIRSKIRQFGVWVDRQDDVYHDVLCRLIEKDVLSRYQESNIEAAICGVERPFVPYLMQAVSNHIINYMKKSNHDALSCTPTDFDTELLPEWDADPTIGIAFGETLAKASRMGVACDSVMRLMLQGLGTSEIAAELKVSEAKIKMVRARLRKALV